MKALRIHRDVEDFQKVIIQRAFQYETDIQSGKEIACNWIKQAVSRSQELRQKYRYDEVELKRIASIFYHIYIPIKDKPTQFVLDSWQCWVLMNLFAIIDPATGFRLHNEAILFVSRKSGKTFFGATILLSYMLKYGGMQSESFCAATSQSQAKKAMEACKVIIRNSPALKERIKQYRDELVFDDGNSKHTLVQLSEPQAERADGSNPSACLYDEFHAYKDERLYEVVQTGMGARQQPLSLIVTTAGFNTVGYPLYERIQLANEILDKKIVDGKLVEDDSTFFALYQLDNEDEALSDDINIFKKANPSLGTTVSIERLTAMRDKAKLLKSSWKHFLIKNCNVFKSTDEDPFIEDDVYVQSCADIPYDELIGARAWIGLDLSQTIDLSAFTILVEHPKTKILNVIPYHYFPSAEKKKRVRANGVDLTEWINDGFIKCHDGDIDMEDIYQDILKATQIYNVQIIGYDPAYAQQLRGKLKSNTDLMHIPIIPVGQGSTTLSSPTKYFEALVTNKKINLGKNPVLRYCNSNCRVKYFQTSSLIRIIKDRKQNPIDSIISTIVGLTVFMETEFDETTLMINNQ